MRDGWKPSRYCGPADASWRLTSAPQVSASPPVANTTTEPPDTLEVNKIRNASVSEQVTSTEPATETAEPDQASTEPTAASPSEPSGIDSTSAPTKPTERAATPRPVVRGSLSVNEQLADQPHRGAGGHSSMPSATGDEAATAASSSAATSSANSSPEGNSSTGGGSSMATLTLRNYFT
jgi:hypothetical protein